MNAVKVIALTPLGQKNINDTKKDCAKWVVKTSLKKLKIKVRFDKNSVTIEHPAFFCCRTLADLKKDDKARKGLESITNSYNKIGAKEGKDYKIEVIE